MESDTATEVSDLGEEEFEDDFDILPLDDGDYDNIHEIIHIIPPEMRRTSEVLDPAGEMANVLLTRIQQIQNGGAVFTDISNCKSATEIAKKELLERKTPLKIRRHVKVNSNEKWVEEWAISEMVIYDRSLRLDLDLLGQ